MIPRYSRPDMVRIWSPENKLELWFHVEVAVADAMSVTGPVPRDAVERMKSGWDVNKDKIIDPEAIDAIERVTKHDVIAFLTHVESILGDDARYLHLGMTSSDLLDTTFALQLRDAGALLRTGLERLLKALSDRSFEHKHAVCMGRSHGIHAEPTTFGIKLAGYYAEFDRNLARLDAAIADISTCAVSGAVGTYANIDPDIEERTAKALGLTPETISTQVIPRDRHAQYFSILGVIASSIERLATEIRHLQRSEVREAEEAFSKGQKGSSAMPHKRNPVLTENLTGLARMVRSAVIPALENVALWHERDISHSSVERMIGPDATITLDFALHRMAGVIENLVVDEARMRDNVESLHGLVFSQRVLLALTESGLARQTAYEKVQHYAMKAWQEGRPLLSLLQGDAAIVEQLGREQLESMFDLSWHTRHVDVIFQRVFGKV